MTVIFGTEMLGWTVIFFEMVPEVTPANVSAGRKPKDERYVYSWFALWVARKPAKFSKLNEKNAVGIIASERFRVFHDLFRRCKRTICAIFAGIPSAARYSAPNVGESKGGLRMGFIDDAAASPTATASDATRFALMILCPVLLENRKAATRTPNDGGSEARNRDDEPKESDKPCPIVEFPMT